MEPKTNKNQRGQWIIATIAFIVVCWLVANWEDFKEGYVAGYNNQTKP